LGDVNGLGASKTVWQYGAQQGAERVADVVGDDESARITRPSRCRCLSNNGHAFVIYLLGFQLCELI
jgi:hypothetical protein